MNPLTRSVIDQCYTKREAERELLELRGQQEKEIFGAEVKADKSDRESQFAIAEAEIGKLPELVIFTAMELDQVLVEAVGKKARKLFGEDLMLEFRVDPSLIGGAALVFGGVFRDYSLKAKLEQKSEEIHQIYFKLLKSLK